MDAWAARRAADVRGRRARALLRPARLRDDAAAALHRPALGARRGAASSSSSTGRRRRRAPFYTATPQDPHGVTLRRRFRTDGRRLLDIADEALDGSIVDGAAVGDFLLEELERRRDVRMRDIVATIQADQYRLITHEPDGAARHPGRAGHRQDGGRAAPRLVAALHRTRGPAAPRRARRRAEPHVHGVRQPRAAGARRGQRRAARGRASSSTASWPSARDPPAVAELKADLRLAEVVRARGRAEARHPSRRSS